MSKSITRREFDNLYDKIIHRSRLRMILDTLVALTTWLIGVINVIVATDSLVEGNYVMSAANFYCAITMFAMTLIQYVRVVR